MTSNGAMLNYLRPTAASAFIALFASAIAVASQPVLDLARYRGRVVVVDFWASWCKPCRQSIPWLNQMRSLYGEQGLVIIGVNVDAERADADRFLKEVPVQFEVLYDTQGSLAEQFHVQAMPSTFVYDRNGNLVHTLYGFRESRRAEHETRLQTLLTRKP